MNKSYDIGLLLKNIRPYKISSKGNNRYSYYNDNADFDKGD